MSTPQTGDARTRATSASMRTGSLLSAASRLRSVIADALHVAPDTIDEHSTYGRPGRWDSLGHVSVLLKCEQAWGVKIDPRVAPQLASFSALLAHLELSSGSTDSGDAPCAAPAADAPTIHVGLRGMVFDETAISRIDEAGSDLIYRGHSINTLCRDWTLERVVSLLLSSDGDEPGTRDWPVMVRAAAACLRANAIVRRGGESLAIEIMTHVPRLHRALPADADDTRLMPALYATIIALAGELAECEPGGTLPQTIARAVAGRELDAASLRAVEVCLIAQAEHGANASAFAARVAAGAGAGVLDSLVAGMASFGGWRHGGAIRDAHDLLGAIQNPEDAHDIIGHLARSGEPVPGFGHRVYHVRDPRSQPLMAALQSLDTPEARTMWARLSAILKASEDLIRLGMVPNVDLFAAALLRAIGLDHDQAYALFVLARVPGWLAHIHEQRVRRVLIRPRLHYTGPMPTDTAG